MNIKKLLFILMITVTNAALANQATIEFAELHHQGSSWNISVTLKHKDTGWNHYANAWQVVDVHNKLLGKRVLLHPHVNEQPFTRSLYSVKIPANVKVIFIEGIDSVHGLSPDRLRIDLRQSSGKGYKINR